jgi:hypothetical protein
MRSGALTRDLCGGARCNRSVLIAVTPSRLIQDKFYETDTRPAPCLTATRVQIPLIAITSIAPMWLDCHPAHTRCQLCR